MLFESSLDESPEQPELGISAEEQTGMAKGVDGHIGLGRGDWKALEVVELTGWNTVRGEGRTGPRGRSSFRNWELLREARRGIRLLRGKKGPCWP